MAARDSTSSPMACDTVASCSVLEEASSSVGDGHLLLDIPKSFRAHCHGPGGDPAFFSELGQPRCEYDEGRLGRAVQ